ncbi:MAG: carboxypeptidase regulatory-like domain-containing protein [Deltaproteobacteria bacterium]|nr:MAG: carboxypeptidase regulatory-like domain-containing protein [Deltaproteobacteria bacterium]
MGKKGIVWLMMLVLVGLSGCSSEQKAAAPATGGQGRIKGQVVVPLEGVTLFVYKPGSDLYGPAFAISPPTGPDGAFDLELPDGDYVAVARKHKDGTAVGPIVAGDNRSDFIKVSVKGGTVEMTVVAPVKIGDQRRLSGDVAATRTGLAGRIVDSDGKPVEGARVHVYDHVQMSERPKFVSEKTGPDGRYLISLPAGGTYYIAARDKFGGPPKLGDLYGRYDQGTIEPSAVVVREGELLKEINITVTKVW